MKVKTAVILKLCIFLTCGISLVSCVTDSTRPDNQTVSQEIEVFNIDSDIEDDFDAALEHLKAEEYDAAIKILEQLIEKEKRVPAPYINLAIAYDKKGDQKTAEKYLLDAVNIDLSHPIANNQLGLLYRKQGRFNDARKAYSNALTKYPDYLPVVKNLGILCELYIRDYPCALQQYEHYQSLQPEDKTMTIWITDLSRRMGK